MLLKKIDARIIFLPSIVVAYDLLCPDVSQRQLRSQGLCTKQNDTNTVYTCLEDVIKETYNMYNESCSEKENVVRPGKRYVIKGASAPDECHTQRYQPVPFYITSGTDCMYLKSTCTDVGQVIAMNGSGIADATCVCDYTEGYAYVTRPGDVCRCVPSEEDCTCYEKLCPENYLLSADYECIHRNATSNTTCVTVDQSGKDAKGTTATTMITQSIASTKSENGAHFIPIIIPLLVIFCASIYIILRDIDYFRTELKNQKGVEGANTNFECEVLDDNLIVQWFKDGTELRTSDKYKVERHKKLHRLVVNNTNLDDQGEYSVRIKNCVRRSELQVQNYFRTELKNQKCIGGGSVHFECEVLEYNLTAQWFKDGTELRASDKYKVERHGKLHRLVVNNTNLDDQGEYSVRITNCVRRSELQVQSYFTKASYTQNCTEGENVHLECEVIDDNQEAEWFKDGIPVCASDKYKVERHGKLHRLVVNNTILDDQGEYSVRINNCVRRSELKVHEKILSWTTEVKDIDIIGHWKSTKDSFDLESIFAILVKYSFCSQSTLDEMKNRSESDKRNFVLCILLGENRSCGRHRNKILHKLCRLKAFLQSPVEKPLWHRRSLEVYERQLNTGMSLLKGWLVLYDLTDDFLQSFVFSLEQFKKITLSSTNSEKIDDFLKFLKETLYRGSFECLLANLQKPDNEKFSLLAKVLTTDLLRASLISGTIYPTSELPDFRYVQVNISITAPINWNGWKDTALSACSAWLIEEFALYPMFPQENIADISLFPVANDFKSRLHLGITNGGLSRLIENIFDTNKLRSTTKSTFKAEVRISIKQEKAKEHRKVRKEQTTTDQVLSGKQSDFPKIISLNKIFMMEGEFYYREFMQRLKESGDLDFERVYDDKCSYKDNKQKFIETLESKNDTKFAETFFQILDAERLCSDNIRKRLHICRKVHAAESPNLREKLIENFGGLVSVMINNKNIIKDYQEMCNKRNIYPSGSFTVTEFNCREDRHMEEILIQIILSEQRDAMLAFVETLYFNNNDFLASDIQNLSCGVLQEPGLNDDALIRADDKDTGDGLFFDGKYQIRLPSLPGVQDK